MSGDCAIKLHPALTSKLQLPAQLHTHVHFNKFIQMKQNENQMK